MKAYKQLQSKAMHKGVFIGYAVVRDGQWTTNGQIMVHYVATPDELKPLKDQIDKRVDGSSMVNFTSIIDTLDREPKVAMAGEPEEWVNEAELQLIRVRGYSLVDKEEISISVQGLYVDYVVALFDVAHWYVTKEVLFAVGNTGEIVAVIAKVKELVDQAKEI